MPGFTRPGRRHLEVLLDLGEEGVPIHPDGVLDHAVVVHDQHLVVGEDHAEEVVVGLLAGVVGVPVLAQRPHPRRRRRPVMAVGDIELGHRGEGRDQRIDIRRLVDHPEHMLDPVGSDEIVGRLPCGQPFDQRIDLGSRAIGQEDRSGVGVERLDVAGPIVLLLRPRVLVLLDQIGLVLVDARPGHETGLDVVAHPLPVEIERRPFLADEHPVVLELLQILRALGIDRGRVEVDPGFEIDLGFDDVQEGQRVGRRHLPRLFAVQNVVGRTGHQLGLFRPRPPRTKGLDQRHCTSPKLGYWRP